MFVLSIATFTFYIYIKTEIAKEKIEFGCASSKPVTEYLRGKAHQY